VHERVGQAVEPVSYDTLRVRDQVVEWKISRGEEGVRADLGLLRGKKFLRRELVEGAVGFWLDTNSGFVKRVE
jgi:hypothetical protein